MHSMRCEDVMGNSQLSLRSAHTISDMDAAVSGAVRPRPRADEVLKPCLKRASTPGRSVSWADAPTERLGASPPAVPPLRPAEVQAAPAMVPVTAQTAASPQAVTPPVTAPATTATAAPTPPGSVGSVASKGGDDILAVMSGKVSSQDPVYRRLYAQFSRAAKNPGTTEDCAVLSCTPACVKVVLLLSVLLPCRMCGNTSRRATALPGRSSFSCGSRTPRALGQPPSA